MCILLSLQHELTSLYALYKRETPNTQQHLLVDNRPFINEKRQTHSSIQQLTTKCGFSLFNRNAFRHHFIRFIRLSSFVNDSLTTKCCCVFEVLHLQKGQKEACPMFWRARKIKTAHGSKLGDWGACGATLCERDGSKRSHCAQQLSCVNTERFQRTGRHAEKLKMR